MSVSTETNKVTYNCSGGTTYEITFGVLLDTSGDAEQIKVLRTTAAGVESELTKTSEWTISGTTVTTVDTFTDGKITLARDPDYTQTVDHQYGGILDADVLDRALDKLTMIGQHLLEKANRVVELAITESGPMVLPIIADRASKVLGFDASGDPIAAEGITDALVSAFMQTVVDDVDASTAQTTLGISAYIKTLLDDVTEKDARQTIGVDWNWIGPTIIGTPLSISSLQNPEICRLSGSLFAVTAMAPWAGIRTYSWDGEVFAQVGSTFTITSIDTGGVTALSETTIALVDAGNNTLTKYSWNGSVWSQVGNQKALTLGAAGISALNGTTVAIHDRGTDDLETWAFDGSDWAQVGAALNITGADRAFLTALNSTDIAWICDLLEELRTYRWSGSAWSQIGNGLSLSGIQMCRLTALNEKDVIIYEETGDVRIARWDGEDWEQQGEIYELPIGGMGAVAALNEIDAAVVDHGSDALTMLRFGFALSGMELVIPY